MSQRDKSGKLVRPRAKSARAKVPRAPVGAKGARSRVAGAQRNRARQPTSSNGVGRRQLPANRRVGWSGTPMANAIRTGPVTSSAPSSIGTTFPRSFFGFVGPAQHLTDQDPEQSVRVTGRDLFDLPIKSGSGTAAAGFGGTAVYYANVAPIEISPRLANLEEMFIFYAIRHLRIFYAPATASTSTTQIALGYTTEADVIVDAIPAPTQAQVMEMESSVLSSAWQPFVFEMKHEGTRLYLTSTVSGQATDIEFQGALACTLLNGVASTTYGQLWVEYVVDFYKPTPLLNDPTWLVGPHWQRDRGWRRSCPPLKSSDLLRDAIHRMPSLPPAPAVGHFPSSEEKKVSVEPSPGPPPAAAFATGHGSLAIVRVDPDDDWTSPSPPSFVPAPSLAPGTPGYRAPVKRSSEKGSAVVSR